MDSKAFKTGERGKITMAKQVHAQRQKEIDERFIAIAEKNIKKDEKLLERLSKA